MNGKEFHLVETFGTAPKQNLTKSCFKNKKNKKKKINKNIKLKCETQGV